MSPRSPYAYLCRGALRISMKRRMSYLGTTTTGFTHGMGPVAASIKSKLINSWNFSSTLDLRLKGVLRITCATYRLRVWVYIQLYGSVFQFSDYSKDFWEFLLQDFTDGLRACVYCGNVYPNLQHTKTCCSVPS